MNVEQINPFIESVNNVFNTMLGCRPVRGEIFLKEGYQPEHLVAGIIGLSGKAKLEHLAMRVSLPTVVTGRSCTVEYPRSATPICIPFECKWGPVAVEVGLVEEPAGEPVAG